MPATRFLIAFVLALLVAAATASLSRPGSPPRMDAHAAQPAAAEQRAVKPKAAPHAQAAEEAGAAAPREPWPPVGALAFAVVGAVLLLRGRIPEHRQQHPRED